MLDLSIKQRVTNAEYWSDEINQLYHPTGYFEQDSHDIIYSADILNTTKFTPILLKEWFFLVKKSGYIVIDYCPNKYCDFQKLEEKMWWLWRGKYEIIFHNAIAQRETKKLTQAKIKQFIHSCEKYYHNNLNQETETPPTLPTNIQPTTTDGYIRFICKKTEPTVIPGDSIDKWSFGIITNGKRKDWMEKIIKSIREQKIPHYEIIVCGTYFDRQENDFQYLPFNQRDDKGWITKKKNLIVQKAKYENICIIHDRLLLMKNWYNGIKKWGNTFEMIGCVQENKSLRINDWILHEKLPNLEFSFVSLLDYKDWDINICQGGHMHIAKKSLLQKYKWNESYMWRRPEDLEISNQFQLNGHIIRFNTFSSVEALIHKFGNLPVIPFNKNSLSRFRKGSFLRLFSRFVYIIFYNIVPTRYILLYISDKIYENELFN